MLACEVFIDYAGQSFVLPGQSVGKGVSLNAFRAVVGSDAHLLIHII